MRYVLFCVGIVALSLQGGAGKWGPGAPLLRIPGFVDSTDYDNMSLMLLAQGELLVGPYIKPNNAAGKELRAHFPAAVASIIEAYVHLVGTRKKLLCFEEAEKNNIVPAMLLYRQHIGRWVEPYMSSREGRLRLWGFLQRLGAEAQGSDIAGTVLADLSRIVTEGQYEKNPYSFACGWNINERCLACGGSFGSEMELGRSNVYRIDEQLIPSSSNQQRGSSQSTLDSIFARSFPVRRESFSCWSCSFINPVVVQDCFIELPELFLLRVEVDSNKERVSVPKTLTLPSKKSNKKSNTYALQGCISAIYRQGLFIPEWMLQLRYPRGGWYAWDGERHWSISEGPGRNLPLYCRDGNRISRAHTIPGRKPQPYMLLYQRKDSAPRLQSRS